jgi:hypothetical protein
MRSRSARPVGAREAPPAGRRIPTRTRGQHRNGSGRRARTPRPHHHRTETRIGPVTRQLGRTPLHLMPGRPWGLSPREIQPASHLFSQHCVATPDPMAQSGWRVEPSPHRGGRQGNRPAGGAVSRILPGVTRSSELVLVLGRPKPASKETPLVTPLIGTPTSLICTDACKCDARLNPRGRRLARARAGPQEGDRGVSPIRVERSATFEGS